MFGKSRCCIIILVVAVPHPSCKWNCNYLISLYAAAVELSIMDFHGDRTTAKFNPDNSDPSSGHERPATKTKR